MILKSASQLTKFERSSVERFFKNIQHRFRRTGLEILLAPRTLDYGRLLISIPRRMGNAPKRNRLKRRVRAIFYELRLFELPFDWAILVKQPEAVKLDFNTLQAIILEVAERYKPKA